VHLAGDLASRFGNANAAASMSLKLQACKQDSNAGVSKLQSNCKVRLHLRNKQTTRPFRTELLLHAFFAVRYACT
jgi:hypothetical protein